MYRITQEREVMQQEKTKCNSEAYDLWHVCVCVVGHVWTISSDEAAPHTYQQLSGHDSSQREESTSSASESYISREICCSVSFVSTDLTDTRLCQRVGSPMTQYTTSSLPLHNYHNPSGRCSIVQTAVSFSPDCACPPIA